MADCYHDQAAFIDIAFDLRGRKPIHAMWHRICNGDTEVEVQKIEANHDGVRATVVERYTFTKTGRPVLNHIESRFRMRDGLIFQHLDSCDALSWSRQAFGRVRGELAGRLGILRRRAARKLIDEMVTEHPEYQ